MNKNTTIILCPTIETTFDAIKDSLTHEGFKKVHIAWNVPDIINQMPDNEKCIVVCDSAVRTDEHFLKDPYRVDILSQKLKAVNKFCKVILYYTVKYNSFFEGVDVIINALDHKSYFVLKKEIKLVI